MLAPSLYSFKSLVSCVVSRYRVMGGTKEHVFASALFLRESERQRFGDFCPDAECATKAGQPGPDTASGRRRDTDAAAGHDGQDDHHLKIIYTSLT